MVESFSGAASSDAAPKGRRLAEGLIDLVLIPIVLGLILGFLLAFIPLEDFIRQIILIIVNIGWLVFRDSVYSPGRVMVGTKLISLTGDKVTPLQALLRNVLLYIPFILIAGYILETIWILTKGERLGDGWAKTRVVLAR
jgi:uncharacterized RDD family membrane protein YckC